MSLAVKINDFLNLQEKQYQLGVNSNALVEDWQRYHAFFSQLADKKTVFAEMQVLIKRFLSGEEDKFILLMSIQSLSKKVQVGLFKPLIKDEIFSIAGVKNLPEYRQDSWQTLKPIIRSLSVKGGGRLKALQKAHVLGYYQNRQLLPYFIDAAGDSYTAVAQYVLDDILPFFGEAGIEAVKASINYEGGRSEYLKYTFLSKALSNNELAEIQKKVFLSTNLAFKKYMLKNLLPAQWMCSYLEPLLNSRSKELAEWARKAFEKLS